MKICEYSIGSVVFKKPCISISEHSFEKNTFKVLDIFPNKHYFLIFLIYIYFFMSAFFPITGFVKKLINKKI